MVPEGESMMVGEAWQVTTAGSWEILCSRANRKQREQTGSGVRLDALKAHPSDILPPAKAPLPESSTASNSATYWVPNVQIMSLWGTFLIQTATHAKESVADTKRIRHLIKLSDPGSYIFLKITLILFLFFWDWVLLCMCVSQAALELEAFLPGFQECATTPSSKFF